jgi:hypothetical protein
MSGVAGRRVTATLVLRTGAGRRAGLRRVSGTVWLPLNLGSGGTAHPRRSQLSAWSRFALTCRRWKTLRSLVEYQEGTLTGLMRYYASYLIEKWGLVRAEVTARKTKGAMWEG